MITSQTIVSDIVRRRPGLAPLFEQLKIDYCCGGNRPLAEACSERGWDAQTVVTLLNVALEGPERSDERVDDLPTAELVEHIVARHHVYLRRQLPRIRELAEKVASGHADMEPRLVQIAALTNELADELLRHTQEEETTLFPAVIGADAESSASQVSTRLRETVARLMDDHEAVGRLLERIRELSDNYTPPEWACNTTRSLYHSLGELEHDVHAHVHKENNILFPRIAG
jgi:regulator of cell morphogenesis and NO signaling